MKEFTYVITDPEGIHARPAGELVKVAAKYNCVIKVAKGDREVDAKRIMGLMSLAIKQGMEISIKTDGEDEDAAIAEIKDFMVENL